MRSPSRTRRVGGAREGGETRIAVASAAGLYVIGGALIATSFALTDVSSPIGAAAVAGDAMLTACALLLAVAHDRSRLGLAWLAELWGILLILVLCASTGGADSPFSMLYFFAVGHAAAFQPRKRFVATSVLGLLAFLAPLAYSEVPESFASFATVGAVLAVLTTIAVHAALESMRADHRRLELLITATKKLDSSLNPQQTLHRIAATALPELAELCVIDLTDEDGTVVSSVAAGVDEEVAETVEAMRSEQRPEILAGHPVALAMRERRTFVLEDLSQTPTLRHAIQRVRGAHGDMRERSATIVPMVARGRLLGTMSFVHAGPPEPAQRSILEDLTGRAALAFDNARLYDERDRVAHTLRRSLMPAELPHVKGLQLESYFRPMGAGSEVGGDFYDVFEDGNCCWLIVGDVCGKGAQAAVLTAFLRHTTVAYAREGGGPGAVLARVNAAMLEHDFGGRFATAILARLMFVDGGVSATVAAAGHPPALLARASGLTEELGSGGTLLGIFPDAPIGESTVFLGQGDSLTLYTDGLVEAQAPARTLTPEQMLRALEQSPGESAQETIGRLLGLVDLRHGARDDIAILTVRIGATVARGIRAA